MRELVGRGGAAALCPVRRPAAARRHHATRCLGKPVGHQGDADTLGRRADPGCPLRFVLALRERLAAVPRLLDRQWGPAVTTTAGGGAGATAASTWRL